MVRWLSAALRLAATGFVVCLIMLVTLDGQPERAVVASPVHDAATNAAVAKRAVAPHASLTTATTASADDPPGPASVKAGYFAEQVALVPPSERTTKTILFYTKVWGGTPAWAADGAATFAGCRVTQCTIGFAANTPQHEWERADALVFHARDFLAQATRPPFGQPTFPRRPEQPWIYYDLEPPRPLGHALPHTHNVFNYSWTYRRQSHIFNPFAAGNTFPSELPPAPPRTDYPDDQAPVAWLAENCDTANKRIKYISELMKHVKIDCLGQCLHNKDTVVLNGTRVNPMQLNYHRHHDGPKTASLVRAAYKFYIAFENSNCEDYITEKYFGCLEHGTIPIVLQGSVYDELSPTPNSFLRASDFPNAKSLADEILRLHHNTTAFAERLAWRTQPYHTLNGHYHINGRERALGPCRLCELMHAQGGAPPARIPNLEDHLNPLSCITHPLPGWNVS